jgi:hypothetical protein
VAHLGCFHSLAIVNSTAINMGVQVTCYSLTYIPSGISQRVELLDSILRSFHTVFHKLNILNHCNIENIYINNEQKFKNIR